MPGHVPGIHDLERHQLEDVDGREQQLAAMTNYI